MEVDVLIDKITDCLEERKSGIIIETRYVKRTKRFSLSECKKWKFNWNIPFDLGFDVYELYIEGSNIVQGRIAFELGHGVADINLVESAPHNIGSSGQYIGVGSHLFAIACYESYKAGFGGFAAFDSKSNLIPHYKKALGAKLLFGIRMVIEENEAAVLINKYFRK